MANNLSQEDATKLAIDVHRVIAHLAMNILSLSMDKSVLFATGHWPSIHEFSARHAYDVMNILGDILNGMDAATDEDKWMEPIFERAHAAFNDQSRPQGGAA